MPSALLNDEKLQDLLGPPTQLSPRTLSGGRQDAKILQLAQGVEGGWPAQAEAPFDRPGVQRQARLSTHVASHQRHAATPRRGAA